MRLVHVDFSKPVETERNFLCLVVENSKLFCKYCSDLFSQSQGGDGEFIFVEGEQRLAFDKFGQIVFDLFSLPLQDKKVIGGLYERLKDVTDRNFQAEYVLIVQSICTFLDKLSVECDMPVDYNEDFSLSDLLKAAKVGLNERCPTLTEKVITFLQAVQSFTKTKIVVFVNIRGYFSNEEFAEILKHVAYSDLSVVCLESSLPPETIGEKTLIIDKDMCEILVGSERM